MKEWFSASELAEENFPGLPKTARNITAKAAREEWRSRPRAGQGGGLEYHVSALPLTAQMVLAQRATRVDPDQVTVPAPPKRRAKAARSATFSSLSDEQQRVCTARAAVVMAYRSFRSANPVLSDRTCRLAFERAWEAGEVFVEPEARAEIRGVSPNTVRAWEDKLADGGLAALVPAYGNRAGSGKIETDLEIKQFLLGILAAKPHVGAGVLMEGLEARFPDRALPSRRSVERFLAGWKIANAQLLMRITNPDAWRSKYKAATGDRSAGIVNPNDCWEADSTPADILLADGHRHKIIGIIDVATRRIVLHVSRESCSTAIASTMRRGLMGWGVPTGLRIDNGSDYTSKHMWRVYDDLQIDVDVCPPFTPEAKPHIERAFKTFSHDLLELLPGYVGHSVPERKDIEARRSFADRMMSQGETVEIRMTPEQLQDFCTRWAEDLYAHRPHGGLNNRTPFQVAAAYTGAVRRIDNERALDILLAPASGDGWCTVTKKGIRVARGRYDAAQLGGLEGSRVKVLFDEADAGGVYVFGEDGQFICRAIDPELEGVSRAELAAARKAHQAAVMKEGVADLKKMQKAARPQELAADILRKAAEKAGKVVQLPRPAAPYSTPALAAAADATAPAPVQTLTPEMRASVERLKHEIAAGKTRNISAKPENPKDRYRHAVALEALMDAGKPLPAPDDEVWLKGYRQTGEYRTQRDLHDEFGDIYIGRAITA